MKIAVLYSGGMDSRILYHYAKVKYPEAEVTAIYWEYGHKADRFEIEHLPKFVEVRKVDWLNLPVKGSYLDITGDGEASYIPGRNLVFAVLTACQELADEVWLGSLVNENHEHNTDRNWKFQELLSKTLTYVLSPVLPKCIIRTPLAEAGLDKISEIEWALDNGLTQEDLLSTWSCYKLNDNTESNLPCGKCGQCFRRKVILGIFGMAEEMQENPIHNIDVKKWFLSVLENSKKGNWNSDSEIMGWFGNDPRWVSYLQTIFQGDNELDKKITRTLNELKEVIR